MRRKSQSDLADLIQRHLRTRASAKKLYERSDRLLAEIAKLIRPGDAVPLNHDGKRAILVDNFEEKAIVWGHGAVRRYEIVVVDA
jgi:hypothetical protein